MNVTFGMRVNIIDNLSELSQLEEVRGNRNYPLCSSLFFSIEYFKIQSQLYFSCPSPDDVLIICKSIIPYNGPDFYIIKFNTCSASIYLAQSHPTLYYPPPLSSRQTTQIKKPPSLPDLGQTRETYISSS